MTQIRKPIHPALMMFSFWAALYAVYLFAPMEQTPAVTLRGFMFVLTMVVIFGVAAFLGGLNRSSKNRGACDAPVDAAYASGFLNAVFIIGILGALMNALAKVGDLQDLSLMAFAALRQERASELLAAEQGSHGLLGALGFLCYPAGFVATVMAILRYEQIKTITRAGVITYFAAIFLLSIIVGGRGMILALIMFVTVAVYLRRCRGLPMIPRSKALRRSLVGLVVLFFVYSTLIWQVRDELAVRDLDAYLEHAANVWGVKPTDRLEWLVEAVGQPTLVRTVINPIFYFTQSLSTVEKILAMDNVPVLLGGFHIDVVAAALRATPESAAFLNQGYGALLDENIYGYFAGAWGGLYIDFGLIGSMLCVAVWGWFAGRAYRTARHDLHGDRVILYVFWLYSVLTSFMSPPLGFSNSAVIFFWFVTYFVFSGRSIRIRLRTVAPKSGESAA